MGFYGLVNTCHKHVAECAANSFLGTFCNVVKSDD